MAEQGDSFEEFLGDDPDFDARSEQLEPASAATKRALYDQIQSKVGPRPENAFLKSKRFKNPTGATIITASLLRTRTKRNADKLATVTLEDTNQHGTRLQTKISVIDAPDGLELSKRITTVHGDDRIVGGVALGQSPALFSGPGRFDPATIRANQEAEQLENQLGLNFVSEVEATELVSLLVNALPHE
jgi:hypothetical protein